MNYKLEQILGKEKFGNILQQMEKGQTSSLKKK